MTTERAELLSCTVTGSGPAVVLIHGTGADAESNWGPLIESLSDRYRVLAPNLPGAGATPARGARLEIDELAAQVIATVRAAGVTRPFAWSGTPSGRWSRRRSPPVNLSRCAPCCCTPAGSPRGHERRSCSTCGPGC